MSVYKEGWYGVQQIGGHQRRIYPDAADFGTPFKKGDGNWITAKTIAHFYAVEGTRKVDTYNTGKTATIDIELMNEFGPNPTKTTKFRLTIVTAEGGIKSRAWEGAKPEVFDGYMTIEEVQY